MADRVWPASSSAGMRADAVCFIQAGARLEPASSAAQPCCYSAAHRSDPGQQSPDEEERCVPGAPLAVACNRNRRGDARRAGREGYSNTGCSDNIVAAPPCTSRDQPFHQRPQARAKPPPNLRNLASGSCRTACLKSDFSRLRQLALARAQIGELAKLSPRRGSRALGLLAQAPAAGTESSRSPRADPPGRDRELSVSSRWPPRRGPRALGLLALAAPAGTESFRSSVVPCLSGQDCQHREPFGLPSSSIGARVGFYKCCTGEAGAYPALSTVVRVLGLGPH
jgi:hypothetical protein